MVKYVLGTFPPPISHTHLIRPGIQTTHSFTPSRIWRNRSSLPLRNTRLWDERILSHARKDVFPHNECVLSTALHTTSCVFRVHVFIQRARGTEAQLAVCVLTQQALFSRPNIMDFRMLRSPSPSYLPVSGADDANTHFISHDDTKVYLIAGSAEQQQHVSERVDGGFCSVEQQRTVDPGATQ